MYSYIKGKLTDIFENNITVEASGLGYDLTVSAACLLENREIGKEVKIYTYLCVRDDGVSLFGFSSKIEKSMFLRLITVSGIGPKVAINILSGIPLSELSRAVATSDTARLSSVKGVGKKTAERIILELKDKMSAEINVDLSKNTGIMSDKVLLNDDAITALVSLGYSKAEAVAASNKYYVAGLSTEELIMKVLKG